MQGIQKHQQTAFVSPLSEHAAKDLKISAKTSSLKLHKGACERFCCEGNLCLTSNMCSITIRQNQIKVNVQHH